MRRYSMVVTEKEKKHHLIEICSLEQLLNIPIAIDAFKQFLWIEVNQENLLFWLDVKHFKQVSNTYKKIKKAAKRIIAKYVKPGSLYEINIDSKNRNHILDQSKKSQYTLKMFDSAQEIVYNHMNLNSFEQFKCGQLYQNLLLKIIGNPKINCLLNQKKLLLIQNTKEEKTILNQCKKYLGKSKKANAIVEELLEMLLSIYQIFYFISSNKINLSWISKSIQYQRFVEKTSQLQKINFKNISSEEKKCFFVNLYNMLALHSFIENGIPKDPTSIGLFMKKSRYLINDQVFSLNDIYHGVLRGNRNTKHSRNNYFKTNDPRKKYIMDKIDPQIHFVLINFTFLTFLNVYRIDNYFDLFNKITYKILQPSVSIGKNNTIHLPRVIGIYQQDFGGTDNIINWITKQLSSIKKFNLDNTVSYSVKFRKSTLSYPNIYLKFKYSTKNCFLRI